MQLKCAWHFRIGLFVACENRNIFERGIEMKAKEPNRIKIRGLLIMD